MRLLKSKEEKAADVKAKKEAAAAKKEAKRGTPASAGKGGIEQVSSIIKKNFGKELAEKIIVSIKSTMKSAPKGSLKLAVINSVRSATNSAAANGISNMLDKTKIK